MNLAYIQRILWSVFCIFPLAVQADFKCWTNDVGVMECGNVVPPKIVSQGYDLRDSRGDVINQQAREMSPEERAKRLAEEKARIEEERKNKEQAEQDRKLLDLYPNEIDIIEARSSRVNRIEKSIEITNSHLQSYQSNLEKFKAQAARLSKRTDKVAQEDAKKLLSHIHTLEQQIKKIEDSISKKEREKLSIQLEFDQILEKYREIQARVARQTQQQKRAITAAERPER